MIILYHIIVKMLTLFNRREKFYAALVVLLAMASAAGESVGILSITPILAVGADQTIIHTESHLRWLYNSLGFQTNHGFIIFLGLVSLAALVVGLSFQALTQWVSAQFVQMRNYTISRRLILDYAHRDYVFFLASNSSQLSETLLTEIQTVVSGVFTPVTMIVSEGCVAISLLIMLCVSSPALAAAVSVILGGSYVLTFLLVGSYVDRVGQQRLEAVRKRYLTAGELFGGIKEIRVLAAERVYFHRYAVATLRYCRTQAMSQLVGVLPQYLMQAVAYGTVLLLMIYLVNTGGNLAKVLPLIGLYALAGRRLLPALQNVYVNISNARFSQPALDALITEMKAVSSDMDLDTEPPHPVPLPFHQEIAVQHLDFQYPTAKQVTLHDINLTIPAGSRIGFVGPTGSGKTTIVDILLGLLAPSGGQLLVDGVPLNAGNMRNWQAIMGYVPQHIYLTDESVTKNIAFGIPDAQVDHKQVERVARLANIHDFIVGEMPQGYDTVVGERGARLSGGQRQRLGIARALYRNPQVLVFDEATSALDNVTERELMKALAQIGGDRTVIMIAHRLSTVRKCDVIFLLENGRLKASGTYDALVAGNARFRDMASAHH
jgi:ABC-type multidrug transport system fused ATPase/permease subunit